MAWVNSSAINWKTGYLIREECVRAILVALFLTVAAIFSVREHDPPGAASASVSPDSFSASRAVRHVAVIAEKPHPLGSTEHAVVRDYLVRELSAAGLEPQIQQATITIDKGPPLEVATVQNILARFKGTASGKAVLLVAHYDSAFNSFGASDDGLGVASLLETLRALKSGPPLKNDVVFLLTDGEENGLLGARAFAGEHPWAREVGVVLNFEARGNSGPVIMFESTDDNGWLIEQFAEAAPAPVAHSLSYEIYKLLPNDTDLTVFKQAGMSGLNFANIDGINRYHTPLDNLQGLDENSLQHQGSYALALARHFGNLDLSQTRERNAVYFDLFGNLLVRYSSVWVIPLTLFVCALFVTLLVFGLRKQKLTVRGIAWGFLSLFVSIVVASLIGWLLWKAVWMIRDGSSAEATQSRLFLWSFVCLAIATTAAVYALVRNRAGVESLAVGALLWWLILMVITTIFLPGGTFLFHWPLLFSLIGLGWMIFAPESKKRSSLVHSLVLSLCALPVIVLVVPVIYQIFIGLTLDWTLVVIAMVVLLFGLLLPHFRLITAPFKWVLPGVAVAAAVILLAAGIVTNPVNAERSSNRILYALNADTGKAVWASDLTNRDERTSQFFTGNEVKGTLADFAYAKTSKQYSLSSAPAASLPAPELSVIEDKSVDGVRALRMRVSSPRQAGLLSVYLDSNAQVVRTMLNNKVIDEAGSSNQWGLNIDGFPQQGVELQLHVRASEPLKIRLVDQSYGLPPIGGSQSNGQSQPGTATPDITFLAKSFSF